MCIDICIYKISIKFSVCTYVYIYNEKLNAAEKILAVDAFNVISLLHRRCNRIKEQKMWLNVFCSFLLSIRIEWLTNFAYVNAQKLLNTYLL